MATFIAEKRLYFIDPSAIAVTESVDGNGHKIGVRVTEGTAIRVWSTEQTADGGKFFDMEASGKYREFTLSAQNVMVGPQNYGKDMTVYVMVQGDTGMAKVVMSQTGNNRPLTGLMNGGVYRYYVAIGTAMYNAAANGGTGGYQVTLDTGCLGTDAYWQTESGSDSGTIAVEGDKAVFKRSVRIKDGSFGGLVRNEVRVITANNVMNYVSFDKVMLPDSGGEFFFGWVINLDEAGTNFMLYSTDNNAEPQSEFQGYGRIRDVLRAQRGEEACSTIYLQLPFYASQVYPVTATGVDGEQDFRMDYNNWADGYGTFAAKMYAEAKQYIGNALSVTNASANGDVDVVVIAAVVPYAEQDRYGNTQHLVKAKPVLVEPGQEYFAEFGVERNADAEGDSSRQFGIGLLETYHGNTFGTRNWNNVQGIL